MALRDMGNPIYDAKANLKNPKMVVYIFEDTKDLREEFTRISFEKKNKKFNK